MGYQQVFGALGYQPRYIANVYYAPDDPHVTDPNQPGYVGSNAPGGGYSGSGSPSSGGGGPAPAPSIPGVSSSRYSGSSGTLNDADRQAIAAMGYANWAAAHNAAVAGGAGGYTYDPNSGGGSSSPAGGYNFSGPSGYALSMGAFGGSQPSASQTWDTLDGVTKSLFESQATANGNPGGGQTLWETQNARNLAKAGTFGPQNYVANAGGGRFEANLAGQLQYFPTQQAAEQAYNNFFGLGNNAVSTASAANATPSVPGALPMDDPRRAQLLSAGFAGNNPLAPGITGAYDPNLTASEFTAISNGAQQAGQEADFGTMLQNQAQSQANAQKMQFIQGLIGSLNGPMAPGILPVINASLQALGLPPIGNGSASANILPNGITPAMWDAMSAAAQEIVLQGWEARGGNRADFINAINAQRPQGNFGPASSVKYAPLAA